MRKGKGMWIITGRYEGQRYGAFGDDVVASVPEWLIEALELSAIDNGGYVKLIPAGPALKVADMESMKSADVVRILEALTTIDFVSGNLPPRRLAPVFADSAIVY